MTRFEQMRTGTYTEPFTQTQYGVFAISAKDGKPKFTAASVASAEDAINKATNYYHSTDADKSEIETFFIRTRPVTYGTWSTDGNVSQDSDAI